MASRKPYVNYAGGGGFGSDSGFIPTGEIRWQDSQGKWHTTYTNSPGGAPTPGGAGVAPRSPTYPSGTPGATPPPTTPLPSTPLPPTTMPPPSTPITGPGTPIPGSAPLPPGGTPQGMSPGGYPWLDTAEQVGQDLSDWERSRRQERQAESNNAYSQNLSQVARFRSQLEARRDALSAPLKRADNSLTGDRLANAQDIHIERPANIPDLQVTGGFRPSMWSENTRQLGRQMSADALAGSGTDELMAPDLDEVPDPNWLDDTLNVAGLVSKAIPYIRR